MFNEATFGSYGFDTVQKTSKIDQLVQRNAKMQGRRATFRVPRMPGSYGWWYLGTVRDTLDFFFFSGWAINQLVPGLRVSRYDKLRLLIAPCLLGNWGHGQYISMRRPASCMY